MTGIEIGLCLVGGIIAVEKVAAIVRVKNVGNEQRQVVKVGESNGGDRVCHAHQEITETLIELKTRNTMETAQFKHSIDRLTNQTEVLIGEVHKMMPRLDNIETHLGIKK